MSPSGGGISDGAHDVTGAAPRSISGMCEFKATPSGLPDPGICISARFSQPVSRP
ncbi:MAG: hypothetical protein WDN03_00360 [Rhizomicrobium sp.]